jgi:hypothetical protein
MSISKCVVRLKDAHNAEHSATVYADSLYEAVIRGLTMLEDGGWEYDRDETIKHVEVEVHQEPTKHVVDVPRLLKWVRHTGVSMSPGQDHRKEKLRSLLGVRKKPNRVILNNEGGGAGTCVRPSTCSGGKR